jgi:hypothetical protein
VGQGDVAYAVEKVFYGVGWTTDPATGVRRLIALLNLTETYEETYPPDGLFSAATQLYVEFSLPTNASGPSDALGLRIRLSYYVGANCHGLNESVCPLGENRTAITRDVFDLEARRILEYRDDDGNGTYDPGEPVFREVSLARPESPFAALWPADRNGSAMTLPFDRNVSWEAGRLTQGALMAGDPLLAELGRFRIAVGVATPINLTLNAFLFFEPTTYKGIPLTPSQLKLDLLIGGVTYVANDTALALELGLTSTHGRFRHNTTGASERLYTSSAAAEAFFTWSTNATVDGRTAPVGSTVLAANESARIVYLSYPRGRFIAHDPVLGLSSETGGVASPPPEPETPQGTVLWAILLPGFLAAATVAVILFWARRRRSRN